MHLEGFRPRLSRSRRRKRGWQLKSRIFATPRRAAAAAQPRHPKRRKPATIQQLRDIRFSLPGMAARDATIRKLENFGRLAQRLERPVYTRKVACSNHALPTNQDDFSAGP